MVLRCACDFDIILRSFLLLFSQVELSRVRHSVLSAGILCAQLVAQFNAECFETLSILWPWCVDVHVVWIYPQIILVPSFYKLTSFFRRYYFKRQTSNDWGHTFSEFVIFILFLTVHHAQFLSVSLA